MKEYIRRETAVAFLENMAASRYLIQCFEDKEKFPAADVAPVAHAYWEEYWDDNYLSWCHKCSNCGNFPLTKEETMHDEVLSDFCPYCGRRMDGGK
jgi:hypothetical protein